MGCVSPDLEKTAVAGSEALQAIKQLEGSVKQQNEANIQHFENEIEKALKQSRIKESRLIEFTSNVKTEYASEFSTDKIKNVVESTLKSVAAAKSTGAFSEDAIAAYTNVVSVISEAAKSKTAGSSDLTFQYHRLMPGVLVFLYAKSTSLSDSKLFGDKTVSSTVIYHKIIESPDDVKLSAAFESTAVDAFNYLQIKALQTLNAAELRNNLFSENYSQFMALYKVKNDFLKEMAQDTLDRLKSNGYNTMELEKK